VSPAPTTGSAPSATAVRVGGDPDGKGWRLGVIGKRTFTIARGRCELAAAQVPLVEEPLYDEGRAVLIHDADVLINRRQADVVIARKKAVIANARDPCLSTGTPLIDLEHVAKLPPASRRARL